MNNQFYKGCIVKLKGQDQPHMTVRWYREATQNKQLVVNQQSVVSGVICEWFDLNMQLREHEFSPESLEVVK